MNKTTKKNQTTGAKGVSVAKGIHFSLSASAMLQRVIAIIFFVAVWAALAFGESALLQRTESMSLFLFDTLYFETMLSVPAGLLSYAGCFLIQFFHYPVLGATIYVLLLFLVYYLTRKAFDIPSHYALLALVPVAAIVASNTQLGYWLFYLKMPGYYYMALLATLLSLLAMWAYRKLGNVWRLVLLALWVIVGYPVMGVYALASALLMALTGIALAIRNRNGIVLSSVAMAVSLLLVYAVPRIYYGMYDTVALELVYTAGVPATQWNEGYVAGIVHENDSFWHNINVFWVPFLLLLFSMVAGVISIILRGRRLLNGRLSDVACSLIAASAALLLSVAFVVRFWYNDANFRLENRQMLAMWEGDWRDVVECAKDADRPSRQIVLNKNLALVNMGRAGDEAFSYPDGGRLPVSPVAVHMTHTDGSSLYYNFGKFNYSYRWCIENSVEYGWKPEYLKNAARSMLLSGEYILARRYTEILKSTMFHADWACELERFIDAPELIGKEKSFAVPLQFACYSDVLGVDEGVEMHLTSTLDAVMLQNAGNARMLSSIEEALVAGDVEMLKSAYEENRDVTPAYIESSMIMTLVKKDSKRFWNLLSIYFEYHMKGVDMKAPKVYKPLPRHYQEAILLFLALDKGRNIQIGDEVLNMVISRNVGGVEANFKRFQNAVSAHRNELGKKYPDLNEARMNALLASILEKEYGNTYYYYYFFVKKIKTY